MGQGIILSFITLCELQTKHIRVVQNIYPHYDAMGSLDFSAREGSLLFRVPIAAVDK